jgi:phage terminase Nu1 subunit (DNA packaging protein)
MDQILTHRIPDSNSPESLGEPLDIPQVAILLGCSVWTVRQKYLPQGLPHLRAGHRGKFVFFRHQVINWILKRQDKGGFK